MKLDELRNRYRSPHRVRSKIERQEPAEARNPEAEDREIKRVTARAEDKESDPLDLARTLWVKTIEESATTREESDGHGRIRTVDAGGRLVDLKGLIIPSNVQTEALQNAWGHYQVEHEGHPDPEDFMRPYVEEAVCVSVAAEGLELDRRLVSVRHVKIGDAAIEFRVEIWGLHDTDREIMIGWARSRAHSPSVMPKSRL